MQRLHRLQQVVDQAGHPSQSRRLEAAATVLFEADAVDQGHHAVQRAMRRYRCEHLHEAGVLDGGQRVAFAHEGHARDRGGDGIAHIARAHASIGQAQQAAARHELLERAGGAEPFVTGQVDEAIAAFGQDLKHGVGLDLGSNRQRCGSVWRGAGQARKTKSCRHWGISLVLGCLAC